MKVPFFSAYPGRSRSFFLLFADVLALVVAIVSSFGLYKALGAHYEMSIVLRLWPIPVMVVGMNLAGRVYLGNVLYPGLPMNPVEELRRQTLSVIASFLFFTAFLTFTRTNIEYSRVALTLALFLSLIFLPIFRLILRHIMWRLNLGRIPVIIMGESTFVQKIITKITDDRHAILKIEGTVSDSAVKGLPNYAASEVLPIAKEKKVYLIYCPSATYPLSDLRHFMLMFHRVLIVEGENTYPVLRTYAANFYNYFAFESGNCLRRKGSLIEKRLFELLLSLIAIAIAIVPMLFLVLLVKLTSKGPVFYVANRLGRKGRPIRVFKFRTMYPDADERLKQILEENPQYKAEWEKNFKLEKDPRITPIGKFLRKTSLDELPQLINVLRGEMALIGPRPIVADEVKYYGEFYETFSSVKPGITGLWQISGRSDIDYETRVALDVYYVRNWSFWLDYYTFFATIREVLLCRGAK
ncbi:MAG: exopolysaccharide biosynthesis polyprenyl glycosylphosphotransferase [bacterium]|nr:exopolysaccharide biosynthesis polyprenyl glycosylphosphotransferase [bacterium]MDO5462759.1 exopolysaccharide biosynthesis polyprenyl glycosylphosphotransferase [bacterium]